MNNPTDNNRIIWMMDETIAHTHPRNWQRVGMLEKALVDTIGNPLFTHEVVDPLPCLREMARQLQHEEFSCVLDLTSWLTPAMQELFPTTPVFNAFSLSRVRVVSSPTLDTTGYKISLSPDEIEHAKSQLDLRKPLIVDDVSFTGWTSRKTMDIWGIAPENATHGFLIANTGDLGPTTRGAVPMLREMGSKTRFGFALQTPRDDGWHLKDLHQNARLEQSFILALLFQETVKKHGIDSPLAQGFFAHDTVIKTVFPDHLTSEEIRELAQGGRFILRNGSVVNGNETHARNPFLWASPYFQQHVDVDKIVQNKDGVISILSELQQLTSDPEGKEEASLELQREIKRLKSFHTAEGQSVGRKERI